MGLHLVLIRVATRHEDVFLVAFADNVFIIGALSKAAACAEDLIAQMQGDLGLTIQVKESWLHVPAWATLPADPPAFKFLKQNHPTLAPLQLKREGTIILCTPLGTPAYCDKILRTKALKITNLLPLLTDLPEGKLHF